MNGEREQVLKQSAMLDLADRIEVLGESSGDSFAVRFTRAEWALIAEALIIAGGA